MEIDRKVRRAAYLLLVRRHTYPGAREWELEKYLGRNYREVLDKLGEYLDKLGFEIKEVKILEEGREIRHFIVVPKKFLVEEIGGKAFRTDEAAVLSIAIALILSSDTGKVSRKEVLELAKTKLPEYRVEKALNKFVRLKYLDEEEEYLKLGLRSFLELDLEELVRHIAMTRETVETSSPSLDREGS